jgi:hypothetical protein
MAIAERRAFRMTDTETRAFRMTDTFSGLAYAVRYAVYPLGDDLNPAPADGDG